MTETMFALLDADGVVTNVIVADQDFIDALPAMIEDPDTDTGDLSFTKAYDVTGKDIGVGHKRAANGKWTAPPVPEPTQEELDAQAAAEAAATQRAEDDAFLEGLRAKTTSLTQDERDRMLLIDASRR